MFAVIEKDSARVIMSCKTKEAAIIAAQLEKEKVEPSARQNITAVSLDDGGYSDIMF